MKIPSSRFQTHRAGTSRRLVLLLSLTVVSALLVAAGLLIVRSRSPILAIGQTERPMDAISLWNEGRYQEVIEIASAQIDDYPLDSTALSLRGFSRFYLAAEEVDHETRDALLVGAIRDLRRVLLLPDVELLGQVHYILGKAYFLRGEFFFDSAIEQLTAARERGVDRLDLYEYLALASRDIGRLDDSIEYFVQAVEIGGEAIHQINLAEVLLRRERFLEADELLIAIADETEDITLLQEAFLILGESYRLQERPDDAIDAYRRILEVNESSAEAHYGLGEAYLLKEEGDLARFEWREAVRLNPNHIESLQRLQDY
jgi:tetratricopeptide (TPR) repeat protein